MKLFFKFFIILFITFNICDNKIKGEDYFSFTSIDLGCLSYTVYPPSGTIIQNLQSFQLQVQFNLNDIRISTFSNSFPILSLSDNDLLNLILKNINQKPIFSLWDKSNNQSYLPNLATSKKTDNSIWLTFLNLPNTNNLYFLNDLGIESFLFQALGPRSITIFSTNGVSPPKIEINSFLNSCPTIKSTTSDFDSKWYTNNPSRPQLFTSTIKVEQCITGSASKICDQNQKYYFSIVLPVSVAKGQLSLTINSIQYQNFQYNIQEFPININIKDDITVVLPMKYNGYYNPPLEMMLSSSNFQDLPFFDFNAIDDSIFNQLIKNQFYDQVFISNNAFSEKSNLFIINPTYDSEYFKKNYFENYFIFSSTKTSNQDIYILVTNEIIFQYYFDIIECPAKSIRNSFTVNQGGGSTYHKIGFLDIFYSQNFLLDQIQFIRNLNLNFNSNTINNDISIELNSSISSTNWYFNSDSSISCQIDFGISTQQYQSLVNSSLLSMAESSNILATSLILSKSLFGSGMNQIGVNITEWYRQSGFCNVAHGSGVNNQIQHFRQSNSYSIDMVIPNWSNIAGYSINTLNSQRENRTTINKDRQELIMKLNSNQAIFKFQIKSFQFLEPMISPEDLTIVAMAGQTSGFECNGQFQVEILNFGKQDGIVHFDIDCQQDIYIEVLNYVQTIPMAQKRIFSVNIRIEKYYPSLLQCRISMALDNKPLWSTTNKSFQKNVTIPIFNGCNIPDPCKSIKGEPLVATQPSSYGVQQGNWISLDSFLNSIEITTLINNVGDEMGDFISTLTCKVISQSNNITNLNYFTINDLNYIITKNLESNGSKLVKFTLYGESSPVENCQLNCTITTKIYNANKDCWPHYLNQNQISTVILYPYGRCVINGDTSLEPTIEFSKINYSLGNASPYFSIISDWSLIDSEQMDPSVIPSKHPLQINSNDPLIQSSVRSDQIEIEKIYDSFVFLRFKNAGNAIGTFYSNLSNCNEEVKLYSSDFQTSIVKPNEFGLLVYRFFSRATNIIGYNIGCSLNITVEMEDCYSDLGKSLYQNYLPIFPLYNKCAGNWLEPSLYENLLFWENNNGFKYKLNNILSNWYYYGKDNNTNNNLYYQDLTLIVTNVEYGEGILKSNLTCISSSTLSVINNPKNTKCYLGPISSCFIKWRVISLATLPETLNSDQILCTQSIKIENQLGESSSCWTFAGKSIVDSFNLTKMQDPCIDGLVNQVFISTILENQSLEIKLSEWGLKNSNDFYFLYNYFENQDLSNSLIYYSFKTIIIENKGSGNGTLKVFSTISNPNVYIISNSSTLACNIKSKSYCSFIFLFAYKPSLSNQSQIINKSDLEINLNFLVDSESCWSQLNKSIQLNIKSTLPILSCGYSGNNITTSDQLYDQVPQVSLIYSKDITYGNLNYYKFNSNPLNLRFSEWSPINEQSILNFNNSNNNNNSESMNNYYSIKLMGYIYNMGDSGGMVTLKINCLNQFKVSPVLIDNQEITTFIESNSYYSFKFLISLKESSINPSIINFNPKITCSVSSIVNNEKCWNPYGKEVYQDILLPLNYFNHIGINSEISLLLYTILPFGLVSLLLLLFIFIKYHQLMWLKFNEWRINRDLNKKLNKSKRTAKLSKIIFDKPLSLLVGNIEENTIKAQIVEKPILVILNQDPKQCGCGQLNPEYNCDKCKISFQNYCSSPLCKNLIHSSTLENLKHQHQPSPEQLIIYNDPRNCLNSKDFFKFKENNQSIEQLIVKKLNKFN